MKIIENRFEFETEQLILARQQQVKFNNCPSKQFILIKIKKHRLILFWIHLKYIF